jgi:hypothetical protein
MSHIILFVEISLTVVVSILIGIVAKNILQKKMKEREEISIKTRGENKYLQSMDGWA